MQTSWFGGKGGNAKHHGDCDSTKRLLRRLGGCRRGKLQYYVAAAYTCRGEPVKQVEIVLNGSGEIHHRKKKVQRADWKMREGDKQQITRSTEERCFQTLTSRVSNRNSELLKHQIPPWP